MKNPCGLCEERFIGCHAECDAYKAWKAEYQAEKDKRGADREKTRLVRGYVADERTAYLRRHRRKKK